MPKRDSNPIRDALTAIVRVRALHKPVYQGDVVEAMVRVVAGSGEINCLQPRRYASTRTLSFVATACSPVSVNSGRTPGRGLRGPRP